jgi:hypothetical protein
MAALVLWTRDPGPLLEAVPTWEDMGIRSLWLITVTGYATALEPRVPATEAVLQNTRRLAAIVGPERISWRYDPILFCPSLRMDRGWHRANFSRLAGELEGAVTRCIVSVYDDYAKARRRLRTARYPPDLAADPLPLMTDLVNVAAERGVTLQSCCEALAPAGVQPGACIDGPLLDRLWNLGVGSHTDPGQRSGCRCAPSVDIGVYNTCTHGCLYCYATGAPATAQQHLLAHDPEAPRMA